MNLKYTLCFVVSGDGQHVLMLYRYNPPNQYMWNGVGGKLKHGETPRECVMREVYEETGILIGGDMLRFAGIVTWDDGYDNSTGMYVYVATLPEGDYRRYMAPMDCGEGMLGWMPTQRVMTDPNVVSNIPCFLPFMLGGCEPMQYHCSYDGWELQTVDALTCPILEGV